ncbi:hypothetical protein GA0115255_101424 [Streptomyces sp. Ncost-T6T-2b]|nr:hypothetical protein GA0115255_101424 [Streptomyces sp. Ncost-T6T-2b]
MSAGPAHSAGVSAHPVDPARVVALVVGVEAYAAGPRWTLPGPVRDALRFRDWLRSTGVPDTNILLHLAPAEGTGPVTGHRGADHETLRRTLVHELPALQGDMLWIWWGGHGVLDRDEHLRLYCADATETDRRNIDLESARRRLSSDVLPGFEKQNWVVDACQTFEERHRPAVTIPDGSLPAGQRLRIHWQSVLLAADRGQRAANDPVRGQGVFSDILLRELATLPGGPAPTRKRSSRPSGAGSTGCAPRGATANCPRSSCTAPDTWNICRPRRHRPHPGTEAAPGGTGRAAGWSGWSKHCSPTR